MAAPKPDADQRAEILKDYWILKAAMRTGVKEVYYGDKRVVYTSVTDQKRALNDMLVDLGMVDGENDRKYASVVMGYGKSNGIIEGESSNWRWADF